MSQALSRRRFLGLSASLAGLALVPFGAARAAVAEAELVTWHGAALGAVATLQIHHRDRAAAEALIQRALGEMRRLEQLFSLYQPDSELVRLNRTGVLAAPAPELVRLIRSSRRFGALTGGAFDPTVQPLWALYLAHFTTPGADPAGPSAEAVKAALDRVGSDRIVVDDDRIVLPRGMALTLNGIAQGFVTDRIVDLLRAEGVDRSLVDMGETRTLGAHPSGRPWQVAIADPDRVGQSVATIDLVNRAVATSGGYGFAFSGDGRFNHLFDPLTGGCANLYRSVSVVAAEAETADALSTAFSLMPVEAIGAALARIGDVEAHVLNAAGLRTIAAKA